MSRPAPSAVLELLKPITWFAPMWAFACGAVSSGVPASARWAVAAAGIALAGPLVCATSQAVNDWFDRHVDAINEPNRPIPSGRIPGRWGFYIACLWTALSATVAASLGPSVFVAALLGLALALRRKVPASWLIAAAFALVPAAYYVVTVQARFRHPLEPLIAILTVYLFRSTTPKI